MDDPTPQEIEARCLEVQSTWTETVRLQRLGGRNLRNYPKGPSKYLIIIDRRRLLLKPLGNH